MSKNEESSEKAKARNADLLETSPKLYLDFESARPRLQSTGQPWVHDMYGRDKSLAIRDTYVARTDSYRPPGSSMYAPNIDSYRPNYTTSRLSSPHVSSKSATASSPAKANSKENSSVKEKILASGASKQELQRALDNFTGDIEKRYGDTVNNTWKAWKIESKL